MDSEAKTSEERLWAAIAHSSILVNLIPPFIGVSPIIAMGIWLLKRKGSSYVGYQALQAFIFQAAFSFVFIVTPIFEIKLILLLAGIGYGLYAAYRCHTGRDFRYLWIGKLIAISRPRE
ncbi:MAG: DUF4870 domain-containing protein [Dehalococcoidia bacterium]